MTTQQQQTCSYKTMQSLKKFLCDLCEKQLDSALALSQHKHCAHPSLILPNLYLGAEDDAESKSLLNKLKIARILNVAGDAKCYFPDDFDYLHLKLDDEPEQLLRPYFQKAFEYIEESLRLGEAVLVHCVLGISRSASFIIAYLMKTRRWSFKESMQFVKERRRFIFPNEGFIKQLGEFEEELSKQGGCKPCSIGFLSLRTISPQCPSSPGTGTQLSRSNSAPHLNAHGTTTTRTNPPLRSSASIISSSVPQKSSVPTVPLTGPHSPVSSASTTSNESEDDKTTSCQGFDFWVSPPSPRPSDPETEPGDDPLSASTSSLEEDCSFVFDSNYDGSDLGGGGGGGGSGGSGGSGSGFSPEEAIAAKCSALSAKKKRASKKKKKQRRQQLRAR